MMVPVRSRPAGLFVLAAVSALVGLAACKEGPRAGAGPFYTATPTPSGSPNATPVPLALGDSAQDAILSPGKTNLYRLVTTTGGVVVQLDLSAEALHPVTNKLDARLTVFGPDGTFLATADDGKTVKDKRAMKDPFLAFTAGIAGAYTVAVDDANGAGGPTGFDYVLRATRQLAQPFQGGTDCLTAVLLTNLNATLTGDTTSGLPGDCCGAAVLPCVDSVVSAPERVYKALLTSGQTFQAVRTGAVFDGAVYITNACGVTALQISNACVIGGDGHDEADGVVFRPAVTGTYWLYVDGVGATSATTAGAFALDLRTF